MRFQANSPTLGKKNKRRGGEELNVKRDALDKSRRLLHRKQRAALAQLIPKLEVHVRHDAEEVLWRAVVRLDIVDNEVDEFAHHVEELGLGNVRIHLYGGALPTNLLSRLETRGNASKH